MNLFIFIADAWGPVSGGINCFNYDLAVACATINKDDNKICCVIPDLNNESINEMERLGIISISISHNAFDATEAHHMIHERLEKHRALRHIYPNRCNSFCIGHDIYTGMLSKRLAEVCNGWNIIFHHMDYRSYYLFNNNDIDRYNQKINNQEEVLINADLVCSVGPKLLKSAKGIIRQKPGYRLIEVVPGVASFDAIEEYAPNFSPIVFGRIEDSNFRVKQTKLAIDAFANAICKDEEKEVIGGDPTLRVIGYPRMDIRSFSNEVTRLQMDAESISGKLCNVVPVEYTNDRDKLGRLISEASVAMMLSFHEGFGLVGYEAIAAGVPLIISKNTGLYMFLSEQQLSGYVYAVDIRGSAEGRGYDERDLVAVTNALREIRQYEEHYKHKALELRSRLFESEKYTWEETANSFLENVLSEFKSELDDQSTVFFTPGEVKRLNKAFDNNSFDDKFKALKYDKHIYIVEGNNGLNHLYRSLNREFEDTYSILIYDFVNMNESCSDFLTDCRDYFGKECDYEYPGFVYVLGERLHKTILILDNFSSVTDEKFYDMVELLDRSNHDFYVFMIVENGADICIKPYSREMYIEEQRIINEEDSFDVNLSEVHKCLLKILSFCGNVGYSRRLVKYVCDGINEYCCNHKKEAMFCNILGIERDLLELGLIEKYSEFSYQNSKKSLDICKGFEVDSDIYTLGIYRLGRFYARCYYLNRDRNPQLRWGYFCCKCFNLVSKLNQGLKGKIKEEYETILSVMRKNSMDTSDYSRYYNVLKSYIDVYKFPYDPWIWYNLIHCESLLHPTTRTLDNAKKILEEYLPSMFLKYYRYDDLYIQFARLCAELEHELNIQNSLENILAKTSRLTSESKKGVAWTQCLSTIVNMAIDQQEYSTAKLFLQEYIKLTAPDNYYMKMIGVAMEANLMFSQNIRDSFVDLNNMKQNIIVALRISKNILKDYRAQGWIYGLLGECQILMEDKSGEANICKSMEHRKRSGERTKNYKIWLNRISRYDLKEYTKKLLEEEFIRVDSQFENI